MCKYGFVRHSLVDYPGEVCGVIFMPGCNLCCPYCHNRTLSEDVAKNGYSLTAIKEYLTTAKRLITGVCITGGEPTLQPQKLFDLITFLRAIDLKIKLDTNGTCPEILEELDVGGKNSFAERVDVNYLAMDLKTTPEKYRYLVRVDTKGIEDKVVQSIEIISRRPVGTYEFRTTLDWAVVQVDDIKTMGQYLPKDAHWYFQPCRQQGTNIRLTPYSDKDHIEKILSEARNYTPNVFLRG